MELWRRLILLICICSAVFLAMVVSLSPLILVRAADFAGDQESEGIYFDKRMMTGEKQDLRDTPLDEYTAKATNGRVYRGDGREWEELLAGIVALKEGKPPGKEWTRRLPSNKYPMEVFFFSPDESPVNTVAGYFRNNNDVLYVVSTKGQKPNYLELKYRAYSNADFHFGGLTSYPHPPAYKFYPYRRFGLGIALLGLALYVLLPRKKDPEAIRYPLWRMVLGDIVAFLIAVPFFAFPFLITGGSLQAFTVGWPLFIFFWPFFFMGIWLLLISAWFAGFSIVITEDRLKLSTYKGKREYFYKDMEFFQPVLFRPPKWLIALSWTAALSGKGASRIGATGRAMILSGSEYGSLGIRMKNGADLYINLTDMIGSDILKGSVKINKAMKQAGVPEKNEVREIRSLGLETVRFPGK